jgi:glycosyltransferase involved in cell wall biosynthesis
MKIFIVFELLDQPTGGGNQFLKMLKKQFALQGALADSPGNTDIFLFNSHHFLKNVSSYKKSFSSAKFVHRIDGPMRLYNDLSDARDQQVYFANETFADATIYQSEWSKNKNLEMGLEPNKIHTTIQNCADDSIFFPPQEPKPKREKIKLFSSSWSNHPKKGFDFYSHLDQNLDFNKYEYFFAGRSPINFKNIKNLGPLESEDLASKLRRSDIFVTASQNDPCSNSLIEALSCGLTCMALNSGGHPEIVKNNDFLFENESDFLKILEKASGHLATKATTAKEPKEVTREYLDFFGRILT